MNAIDEQLRRAARQEARATRLEVYASWIVEDVDGLTFQLANTEGLPPRQATAILADARALVALALSRIDQAIEADRKAHSEECTR